MNASKWELTRNKILSVPLPEATKTYSPVPHSLFLEEVAEKVTQAGYIITNERYLSAYNYQLLTGVFSIKKPDQSLIDLSPSLYFINSYNKKRKASLRAGAMVLVCKNGMLGSVQGGSYSRIHRGTALEDFRDEIDSVIGSVEIEFQRLEKNVAEMKETKLSSKVIAQLVGDMYINESLLSDTQLSILKKEMKFSENFKTDSLWDFYNNCTEAYKSSHPSYFEKQHIKFHTYITDKFDLSGSRDLYGKSFAQEEKEEEIQFIDVDEII